MSKPQAQPPQIFDRSLARVRLQRAAKQGFADFLLARVADELVERLAATSRRFPQAVELGAPASLVVQRLRELGQIGTVVRLAPVPPPAAEQTQMTLVADEEALPLAEKRFDLAVSVLALQGVNDPLGALTQIRRSLKPDGLFLGCLVGGRSLFELRDALAVAEAEVDGGMSPRVAPFARVEDMSSIIQRAGFAMPVVDIEPLAVRYADLLALLHDLRSMGATNVLHERRRTPLKRSILRRAAEVYVARHADADGRIRATCELIWLSGWAPDLDRPVVRPGPRRRLFPAG